MFNGLSTAVTKTSLPKPSAPPSNNSQPHSAAVAPSNAPVASAAPAASNTNKNAAKVTDVKKPTAVAKQSAQTNITLNNTSTTGTTHQHLSLHFIIEQTVNNDDEKHVYAVLENAFVSVNDINIIDADGITPFLLALKLANTHAVAWLIKKSKSFYFDKYKLNLLQPNSPNQQVFLQLVHKSNTNGDAKEGSAVIVIADEKREACVILLKEYFEAMKSKLKLDMPSIISTAITTAENYNDIVLVKLLLLHFGKSIKEEQAIALRVLNLKITSAATDIKPNIQAEFKLAADNLDIISLQLMMQYFYIYIDLNAIQTVILDRIKNNKPEQAIALMRFVAKNDESQIKHAILMTHLDAQHVACITVFFNSIPLPLTYDGRPCSPMVYVLFAYSHNKFTETGASELIQQWLSRKENKVTQDIYALTKDSKDIKALDLWERCTRRKVNDEAIALTFIERYNEVSFYDERWSRNLQYEKPNSLVLNTPMLATLACRVDLISDEQIGKAFSNLQIKSVAPKGKEYTLLTLSQRSCSYNLFDIAIATGEVGTLKKIIIKHGKNNIPPLNTVIPSVFFSVLTAELKINLDNKKIARAKNLIEIIFILQDNSEDLVAKLLVQLNKIKSAGNLEDVEFLRDNKDVLPNGSTLLLVIEKMILPIADAKNAVAVVVVQPNEQKSAPTPVATAAPPGGPLVLPAASITPAVIAAANTTLNTTTNSTSTVHSSCRLHEAVEETVNNKDEKSVHAKLQSVYTKIGDINIVDSNGRTPLLLALELGNVHAVDWLIQKIESSWNTANKLNLFEPRSPNRDIFLRLVRNSNVNGDAKEGSAAVSKADEKSRETCIVLLKTHIEKLRPLPAILSIMTEVITKAAKNNDFTVIKLLLLHFGNLMRPADVQSFILKFFINIPSAIADLSIYAQTIQATFSKADSSLDISLMTLLIQYFYIYIATDIQAAILKNIQTKKPEQADFLINYVSEEQFSKVNNTEYKQKFCLLVTRFLLAYGDSELTEQEVLGPLCKWLLKDKNLLVDQETIASITHEVIKKSKTIKPLKLWDQCSGKKISEQVFILPYKEKMQRWSYRFSQHETVTRELRATINAGMLAIIYSHPDLINDEQIVRACTDMPITDKDDYTVFTNNSGEIIYPRDVFRNDRDFPPFHCNLLDITVSVGEIEQVKRIIVKHGIDIPQLKDARSILLSLSLKLDAPKIVRTKNLIDLVYILKSNSPISIGDLFSQLNKIKKTGHVEDIEFFRSNNTVFPQANLLLYVIGKVLPVAADAKSALEPVAFVPATPPDAKASDVLKPNPLNIDGFRPLIYKVNVDKDAKGVCAYEVDEKQRETGMIFLKTTIAKLNPNPKDFFPFVDLLSASAAKDNDFYFIKLLLFHFGEWLQPDQIQVIILNYLIKLPAKIVDHSVYIQVIRDAFKNSLSKEDITFQHLLIQYFYADINADDVHDTILKKVDESKHEQAVSLMKLVPEAHREKIKFAVITTYLDSKHYECITLLFEAISPPFGILFDKRPISPIVLVLFAYSDNKLTEPEATKLIQAWLLVKAIKEVESAAEDVFALIKYCKDIKVLKLWEQCTGKKVIDQKIAFSFKENYKERHLNDVRENSFLLNAGMLAIIYGKHVNLINDEQIEQAFQNLEITSEFYVDYSAELPKRYNYYSLFDIAVAEGAIELIKIIIGKNIPRFNEVGFIYQIMGRTPKKENVVRTKNLIEVVYILQCSDSVELNKLFQQLNKIITAGNLEDIEFLKTKAHILPNGAMLLSAITQVLKAPADVKAELASPPAYVPGLEPAKPAVASEEGQLNVVVVNKVNSDPAVEAKPKTAVQAVPPTVTAAAVHNNSGEVEGVSEPTVTVLVTNTPQHFASPVNLYPPVSMQAAAVPSDVDAEKYLQLMTIVNTLQNPDAKTAISAVITKYTSVILDSKEFAASSVNSAAGPTTLRNGI